MLVWDTPAHMAEETKDAARVVPKAIMTSYVLGGFLNIGLLISYLACLNLENYQYSGDYDENFGLPLETPDNRVAAGNFLYLGVTNGLFPIGNIFYDSFMARYGRAEGAAAFTFFIFMVRRALLLACSCCAC
jgi:amino acid transporter